MGIAYFLGGKIYDYLDEHFEKTRYYKIRKKMWYKLKGKVLDAGCGTGRNFQHFHPKTKVTAVDISRKMLKVAVNRANESKATVSVKKMDLTDLHFKDNVFDAIVATFVLCVMPKRSEKIALKELIRVAKPNARLYFLEYVYSKNKFRSALMKMTSLIPKILYNLRYNSTLPIIKEEKKLKVESLQFVHEDVLRLIVARKVST